MATEPKLLKDALERFLRHLGAPPVDTLSTLQTQWSTVVGPALSERTQPQQITNGVLTIQCEDSAWASQITWSQSAIMQRFQQLFPQVEISRVVTRIGKLQPIGD